MTYQESLLLTGNEWTSLSDGKKIEVLQTIENHMAYESNRVSVPVEGRFLHTGSDGIVLGSYDPRSGRIYINVSQFDSESMYGKDSSTIVTTCLHEGRHAYQHQVVSGIVQHDDPNEAAAWSENLKDGNYISFEENPRGYYEQPVEVDAREFAACRYKEMMSERLQAEMERPNDYSKAKDAFETQICNSPHEGTDLAADYHRSLDGSKALDSTGIDEPDGIHH